MHKVLSPDAIRAAAFALDVRAKAASREPLRSQLTDVVEALQEAAECARQVNGNVQLVVIVQTSLELGGARA